MSILFLFNGCGDKGTPGLVGHPTEIMIDLMTEEGKFNYEWTILNQPDASLLSTRDISATDNPAAFTFVPDAGGFYTFEVIVSQYGDELFTEIHSFDINDSSEDQTDEEPLPISTPAEPVKTEEPVIPEVVQSKPSWLDEEFPKEVREVKPNPVEEKEPVVEEPSTPKEVKAAVPRPGSTIPYLDDRYTIQVASSKSLGEAENVALKLIEKGYDAYIQKAFFKETNAIWYRVRVGSYEKRQDAIAISKKIKSTFGYSIWIDFVRKEN